MNRPFFQEPEDDPRNFCYVWSVQGDNDFDTEREKSVNLDSKASITLHALSFQHRQPAAAETSGGGEGKRIMSYSNITSCSPRFTFSLDSDKLDSEFQVEWNRLGHLSWKEAQAGADPKNVGGISWRTLGNVIHHFTAVFKACAGSYRRKNLLKLIITDLHLLLVAWKLTQNKEIQPSCNSKILRAIPLLEKNWHGKFLYRQILTIFIFPLLNAQEKLQYVNGSRQNLFLPTDPTHATLGSFEILNFAADGF